MAPTNALVFAPSGSPAENVRRTAKQLDGIGDHNVVIVVYGTDPRDVRAAWYDRIGAAPKRLGIIGVGPFDRSPEADPSSAVDDREVLTTVRDPTDVSSVGITISLYLNDWASDAETRLGFHSLTALLDHADTETAFRFLHVLTRRLADVDASGRFYLDPAVVDDRTIETLRPVFDTTIGGERTSDVLSPDVAFDLLRASRRRYVLYYLLSNRDSTTVDALATHVARREGLDDPDRVATSLHHSHLPKLADAGLVSVESGDVTPLDAIASIEPYLSLSAPHDLPTDASDS